MTNTNTHTAADLVAILASRELWLADDPAGEGKQADLSRAMTDTE